MMKTKWMILIFLLTMLLFSCSASALTISNVKISGVSVPKNYDTYYLFNDPLVSRAKFEGHPVITFDVTFDDANLVVVTHPDGDMTPIDPRLRYNAVIFLGSYLYNKKAVYLGSETGTFEIASGKKSLPDPWLSPYVTNKYDKGDTYAVSVPLTPGKTSYSYTIQNPEMLCFDAHRYECRIYGIGRTQPTVSFADVDDAKWNYNSGGNSDDSGYGIYQTYWLAQEFLAKKTYDLNEISLKLYREGVLPANYQITISIRSNINGADLSTYSMSNAEANAISTSGEYWIINMPKVRITQGQKYFIYVKSTNFGDPAHCIAWRKDTGSYGFPHYGLGVAGPWYYLYAGSGSSYNLYASTAMFTTSGISITPTYTAGQDRIYYDYSKYHTFFIETYGDKQGSDYWTNKFNEERSTSIFFGNAVPAHMEMQGSNAIRNGVTFDTASVNATRWDEDTYHDQIVPVTVVLCDKDRNIKASAVYDSYLSIQDTYETLIHGASEDTFNSFKQLQYKIGDGVITGHNAYYMYIGLPSNRYTVDNTYMTVDDTMKKTNWSASKLSVGGKVSQDDSQDNDYWGAYVYFETQQAYVDEPWAGAFRSTPSWLTNFIIWCSNDPPAGVGLPWMPVLFGFLPAILIVGILYSYMRKWQISLPNYVYSVALIGGLYIGWMIGLLALWIFILISVSVTFVSLYNFREPISTALSTISGWKAGKALEEISMKERRAEIMAERGTTRMFVGQGKAKDIGVKPSYDYSYKIKELTGKTGKRWTIEPGQTINGKRTLIATNPTNTVTREIDLGILASNGHKVKVKPKRKRPLFAGWREK